VGIGLSLVSSFAELHGGRAWVEDRPGGGCAFKVLLPGGCSGDHGAADAGWLASTNGQPAEPTELRER
jgi:signal transduction histidine kinase